jgi:antirestriction protein ArdC
MRPDVYQQVTDRIIAVLEAGTVPWQRPWTGGGPVNVRTGRLYRGINVFLLELMGFGDPRWGTYKAIREAGGYVRAGEHGTAIILGKRVQKKRSPQAEPGEQELNDSYFLYRSYKVFNAEQCENLQPLVDAPEFEPLERAESIIYGYPGPTISIGGGEASYSETTDIVRCPAPEHFPLRDNYYATLYHELVHSTGHKDRLARLESTGFGTSPYAKEELVAEMGAAMLCGIAQLDPHIEQSAAYIANWLQALQNDKKLVVQAGALAQKACDLMLGTKFEEGFSAAENREAVAA